MSLLEKVWAARMARLHESVHRDRTLAIHVSKWKRVLFLLTNLPYFVVALQILHATELKYPGKRFFETVGTYFCESSTTIGVGVLAVGLASSAMHFSQMKLLNCDHEASQGNKSGKGVVRVKPCVCSIYAREVFIMLKHMDVGCVFCGLLAGILCYGLGAVLASMLPVGE